MGTIDSGILPTVHIPVLKTENLDLVYFEELKVYEVCATVKPKLSLGPLKNSFTRVQETCCLLGRTADYDI